MSSSTDTKPPETAPPKRRQLRLKEVVAHSGGALISVIIGLLTEKIANRLYPYLTPIFSPLLTFLRDHVSEAAFQLGFVVLVTLASIALYLLRSRQRRLYASLEIVFGVSVAVYAANQTYVVSVGDTQLKNFFATMAGIYVIIRGLDNWFYQGKT